ncbi:hypothetical protein OS493_011168 [Desmophyllum pertusum]|uniref:B-related factor 1 n=1 Tax=Desmophyllum pertusum TaxID=174260 RepID=A0A9W9Z215_9CNID|nr:hypothetical protein OS493_011168 [Desmophyllum pertusum]
MPSECPNCHEMAVDEEPGGEVVCRECGAVVDSRVFNFETDGTGWTLMSADGTAKFDGRFELGKAIRKRLPTSDTSASKKQLQKCLYLQVKRMKLSNDILLEAREFLFTTVTAKINSGEIRHVAHRRSVFVASCLFIVCRRNNIQLTYKRMAEVAECNMFLLGKSVKNILKTLDITLDPLGVEAVVLGVLSQLSVTDKSCKKLSLDLWHIFKYFSLLAARNHIAASTALVLLVLESKKISPSKEKIAEILGKNSVTDVQLKTQLKNVRSSLLELAKDVPWIPKSVRRVDIVRHIVNIVDFHKKCGKLDLSLVKSLWMKRKELAEKDRKTKIQMAKARILDKEQGQPSSGEPSSSGETDSCHSLQNSVSSHQGKDEVVVLQSETTSSVQTADPRANSLEVSVYIQSSNCASSSSDVFTSGSDSDLDDNDVLIENLLKSGYSEEELMDGYFESRMCDLQSSECDPEGEREDLDELDIGEMEMHHYLWSVAEMERIRNLKDSEESQQEQD